MAPALYEWRVLEVADTADGEGSLASRLQLDERTPLAVGEVVEDGIRGIGFGCGPVEAVGFQAVILALLERPATEAGIEA